ncbi:unnamed protein product [Blepharisma stoltei]|uniref:SSD domain-containing protein n=1 Tax=Blepharisma stoltei TaxID=1481888 RepID=A0AAU9K870_9CILI|nr:unnamed protein product [Blepharisma stoltei]
MEPTSKLFFKVGQQTSKHPKLILTIQLLISISSCIGFFWIDVKSSPHSLWVDTDSSSHHDKNYVDDNFGPTWRINRAIFTAKDSSVTDVFQREYLEEVWKIQSAMETMEILYDNQLLTLDYFCHKPGYSSNCYTTSPMNFWKMNVDVLMTDLYVKQVAMCLNNAGNNGISCYDRNGLPIRRNSVFGGTSCDIDGNGNCSLNAKALILTFYLNDDQHTIDLGARVWERRVFEHKLRDFNNNEKNKLKVSYGSQRALHDKLQKYEEVNPLIIGIPLLFLFIVLGIMFSSLPSKVHSRFLLSAGAISIIIASVVIAIGSSPIFDKDLYVITIQVLPLLLIILGAGHYFVIIWANDKAKINSDGKTNENILAETMKNSGPILTVAFLSELTVFIIGCTYNYPGIREFCESCVVGLIFLYIFQVTGFPAMLELDTRRIHKKRIDVLCCFDLIGDDKLIRRNYIKKTVNKWWIPSLFNIVTKISCGLIALSLMLLAFGGMDNVHRGLNPQVLAPSGSNLQNYYEDYEKYMETGELGYLVLKDLNYTSISNRNLIMKLSDSVSQMTKSVQGPVYAWINPFTTYLNVKNSECNNTDISEYDFNTQLQRFLQVPYSSSCCKMFGVCGELYRNDIVFSGSSFSVKQIKTTRLRFYFQPLRSQHEYIRAYRELKHAADKWAKDFVFMPNNANSLMQSNPAEIDWISSKNTYKSDEKLVFSFGDFFEYYQQYNSIRGDTLEKYFICIAVFLFVFELFFGAYVGFIITFLIALSSWAVVGLCFIFNEMIGGHTTDMNAVSGLNFLISCCIAIESIIYVTAEFLNKFEQAKSQKSQASRDQNSKIVISQLSPILVGQILTQLIGIIPLACFSSDFYSLYFFRIYLFAMLLGLFYGTVLQPIVLSYLFPVRSAYTSPPPVEKELLMKS